METTPTFRTELEWLINKHSIENESNTPDYVLATYLWHCLAAWNIATSARDKHKEASPNPPKITTNI